MCYDGIISIRGLCSGDTAKYFLDDYGISLLLAANAADEKFKNGKKLIESKIDQAWKQVFRDIQFKGLDANKILNDVEVGKVSDEELTGVTGFKGVKFTLKKGCKLSRHYLYKVSVSVHTGGSSTVIKLVQNGEDSVLYTGVPDSGDTVEIVVNDWVEDTFKILVDTTNISVYSGTTYVTNTHPEALKFTVESTDTSLPGQNFGIVADMQVRCDKYKYLCKFTDVIAQAVVYKAAAMFWKEISDTNRFNDLIEIKKDKAVPEMAWLDSTYNLLQYDPAVEITYAPKGMYQKELEKINIPLPSCACCLECNQDRYQMVLP